VTGRLRRRAIVAQPTPALLVPPEIEAKLLGAARPPDMENGRTLKVTTQSCELE
jgi:hypothetical protein